MDPGPAGSPAITAGELLRLGGRWERLSSSSRPTSRPTASSCRRWPRATGTRRSAGTGGCARTWNASSACRPGPESEALYEECVAGLGAGRDGFVGRQVELARLTAAAAVGRAGRGGCARGPRSGRDRQVGAVPRGRGVGAGTGMAGRHGRRQRGRRSLRAAGGGRRAAAPPRPRLLDALADPARIDAGRADGAGRTGDAARGRAHPAHGDRRRAPADRGVPGRHGRAAGRRRRAPGRRRRRWRPGAPRPGRRR